MSKTTDPIFAAYARTAPLEDLRFYLRAAERTLMEFELPEATLAIMREMTALEQDLAVVAFKPAHKSQVWTLIDRYKTSIPKWVRKGFPPVRTERRDRRRWVGHRSSVPQRLVPLTLEQARALIQPIAGEVTAPAPRATKARTAAAPTLACPSCRAALLPVATCADTWGCLACRETWRLTSTKEREAAKRVRSAQARVAIASLPRAAKEPADATTRTCRVCTTEQPIDQFTYGDAGRTVRHMCRTCHKQQQRDAAARRKQAA